MAAPPLEPTPAPTAATPLPASAYPVDVKTPVPIVVAAPPLSQPQPTSSMDVGQRYQNELYAQCAAGNHQVKTEYGVFGIVVALACFPCGLIALCIDNEKKCSRCGVLVAV